MLDGLYKLVHNLRSFSHSSEPRLSLMTRSFTCLPKIHGSLEAVVVLFITLHIVFIMFIIIGTLYLQSLFYNCWLARGGLGFRGSFMKAKKTCKNEKFLISQKLVYN
jgi:hypothetical protein